MHRRVLITVVVAAFVATLLPAAVAQNYSEWGEPVHLDVPINSPEAAETNPSLSRDGLSLYFLCIRQPADRPAGCPNDLGGTYVVHRASLDSPWEAPIRLPETVNASGADYAFISGDGHRLYFHSKIKDGYGGDDMFVSRRHDKDNDGDWGEPENLGPGINTTANEHFGSIYEDEQTGDTFLYFASDRAGGTDDFYVSKLQPDGTFGEAAMVTPLSSSDGVDRQLHVRRDGLECVWMSNREGSIHNAKGLNSYDLWFSTRATTSEGWSIPQHFETPINTGKHEGGPSYSFDGSELYFFAAQRDGNFGIGCPDAATCFFDIWVMKRQKLTGKGKR